MEIDRNYYRKSFFEFVGSVDQILYYRHDWMVILLNANRTPVSVQKYANWLDAISDILSVLEN